MSRIRPIGLARAAVVFGAGIAFPFLVTPDWLVNIGVFTLMYAGLATAWNLFSGYTGYISLGQAAFFGIGAYTLAITFNHISIGGVYRPFYVLPLIGVAVPQPSFSSNFDRPYYFAMLGILALGMLVSWYVRGSKLGLQLLAVREDEEKARGLGVRVTGAKLIAWGLHVGLTAMIGAVWGYYLFFIYPESAVDPLVMIGAVLMTFLGGKGTLWGPMIGALVLVPAQQWALTDFGATRLYLIAYSLVFVVVLLLLPQGIVPSLRRS